LLLDLFAEGELLPVESEHCVHILYFVDGPLLLLQELDLLSEGGLVFGTEELETALQVVEFDGELLVLVCHSHYLRVHYLHLFD
jgi:hypothetical protein